MEDITKEIFNLNIGIFTSLSPRTMQWMKAIFQRIEMLESTTVFKEKTH